MNETMRDSALVHSHRDAGPKRRHISFTQLNMFLRCPRQYENGGVKLDHRAAV